MGVSYTAKDITHKIGDAKYPTEGELAMILRAIPTNTDTVRKIQIYAENKETVAEFQTHWNTNKTARAIQKTKKHGA